MAQLAYNNKLSEATGKTPYFANYGRHLNLFTRTLPSLRAEAAMQTAEEIKKTYKEIEEQITKA
jgi:hypothetical protein